MKKYILLFFLILIFLASCFKDEGNYDYIELGIQPQWMIDPNSSPIRATGYMGSVMKFLPQGKEFTFGADSAKAADLFRYEWVADGDIVFSTECNFELLTDSVMARMGMTNPGTVSGLFKIINKENGVTYTARTWLTINPRFSNGTLIVLAEKGENSKCFPMPYRSYYAPDGKRIFYWTMEDDGESFDDMFYKVNGYDIPGKPNRLYRTYAIYVSSIHGMMVGTSKGAVMINPGDFSLYHNISDEFLDGVPENFSVSDIYNTYRTTYLATEDGRVFKRDHSANYISGKFLSEPYFIDDKGYKITKFRQHTNYGPALCFDEKNRRLLLATDTKTNQVGKIAPIVKADEADFTFKFWNIPENIDIIHIAPIATSADFEIFYNQNGLTYVYPITIRGSNNAAIEKTNPDGTLLEPEALPVFFDEKTILLTSRNKDAVNNNIIYSKGNELRNYNRITKDDYRLEMFTSTISYLSYQVYFSNFQYKYIQVGCENGDLYVFDVYTSPGAALLITKVNVGGKVIGAVEIGFFGGNDTY